MSVASQILQHYLSARQTVAWSRPPSPSETKCAGNQKWLLVRHRNACSLDVYRMREGVTPMSLRQSPAIT
jgi:hypothetical protein